MRSDFVQVVLLRLSRECAGAQVVEICHCCQVIDASNRRHGSYLGWYCNDRGVQVHVTAGNQGQIWALFVKRTWKSGRVYSLDSGTVLDPTSFQAVYALITFPVRHPTRVRVQKFKFIMETEF